ncbi:MAG TPA: hypothetical protein VGR62_17235 [Candidatus Binatia bacterium]|jgi:hypothetical protein|nr:hypothetical protein [Candidatus Binatia bacterium]
MTVRTLALLVALLSVAPAHAADPLPAPAKAAVDKVLADEKAELQGSSTMADLDGDGTPEVVFVWSQLGVAHPKKALVVLAHAHDGYHPLASTPLSGEVVLGDVKDGIITVVRYPLHPPKCCPSKKYFQRYLLMAGRLVDAK